MFQHCLEQIIRESFRINLNQIVTFIVSLHSVKHFLVVLFGDDFTIGRFSRSEVFNGFIFNLVTKMQINGCAGRRNDFGLATSRQFKLQCLVLSSEFKWAFHSKSVLLLEIQRGRDSISTLHFSLPFELFFVEEMDLCDQICRVNFFPQISLRSTFRLIFVL